MRQIYLDNSASTKISEEALLKYVSTSREIFGNPSSLHSLGFLAEKELEAARAAIRESVSAKGASVVFTGSGREANNLAITGRAFSKERYRRGAKIITTEGEHASVGAPLAELSKQGYKIAYVKTRGGELDFSDLARELTPDVILVTMMMVNNETGARYDIERAAKLTHAACPDALFHVDATQSYLKMPISKTRLGFDMMSISSHKIEGPKGVGALIIDERVIKSRGLSPIIFGGGQEGGLRSGTENVPAIAAFGEAARIGAKELPERAEKLARLRAYFLEKLNTLPELSEISPLMPSAFAPHIVNISLPDIKSETMLHFLSSEGIFVSSGSACSSNSRERSGALLAFGLSERRADTSIRISFSHRNETEDIDALCSLLIAGLSRLSRMK